LHKHEAELGLQIRVSSLIQQRLVHQPFITENIIRVTLHFSCTILGLNLSDPSDLKKKIRFFGKKNWDFFFLEV
jgi:hypothetical protein